MVSFMLETGMPAEATTPHPEEASVLSSDRAVGDSHHHLYSLSAPVPPVQAQTQVAEQPLSRFFRFSAIRRFV